MTTREYTMDSSGAYTETIYETEKNCSVKVHFMLNIRTYRFKNNYRIYVIWTKGYMIFRKMLG